jgi:hypothetical protein
MGDMISEEEYIEAVLKGCISRGVLAGRGRAGLGPAGPVFEQQPLRYAPSSL